MVVKNWGFHQSVGQNSKDRNEGMEMYDRSYGSDGRTENSDSEVSWLDIEAHKSNKNFQLEQFSENKLLLISHYIKIHVNIFTIWTRSFGVLWFSDSVLES